MKTKYRIATTLAAIITAVAMLVIWIAFTYIPSPDCPDCPECESRLDSQAAGKERIGWAIISKLNVEKGGANFDSDVTTTGNVSAVNVSASGAVNVTGALVVTGTTTSVGLALPSTTSAVITDGTTITVATTYYALTNSVASTITLAAVGTSGQELVLAARTANEITINDTNIRTPSGGVLTMTQYTITGWRYQDDEWLLEYRSENQ